MERMCGCATTEIFEMFTGIIETVGELVECRESGQNQRHLQIRYAPQGRMRELSLGESVAVNGVCLTACEIDKETFAVEVSATTLQRTTLGDLSVGAAVNLEPALRVGDSLGGHFVTGHVDAVATIARIEEQDDCRCVEVEVPVAVQRYVVPQGSVSLDGTSLTVTQMHENHFGVTIVPYTSANTLAGNYQAGTRVNLEIDVLARHLEKLLSERAST